MSTIARVTLLGLLALAAVCAEGLASEPFLGACYCQAAGTLECTPNLSERECRRQCDEALCDDWYWKERLPCWNWGYGG
jgi:hypothetical protein